MRQKEPSTTSETHSRQLSVNVQPSAIFSHKNSIASSHNTNHSSHTAKIPTTNATQNQRKIVKVKTKSVSSPAYATNLLSQSQSQPILDCHVKNLHSPTVTKTISFNQLTKPGSSQSATEQLMSPMDKKLLI